jgi:hypothetical protein
LEWTKTAGGFGVKRYVRSGRRKPSWMIACR